MGKKSYIIHSISLVFLGIFFTYLLFSENGNGQPSQQTQQAEEIAQGEVIEGVVKKGSSLYASMTATKIPPQLTNKITSALHTVFDLKHSLPGDKYRINFIPPDTVLNFEYKTPGLEKYIILPKGDSLVAMKVYKELKRFLRGVKGEVKGSLWETLVKMGENPTLIGKLADIFAWDIDFLTDVRNGNEFDFVVECFEEDGKIAFYGDILVGRYILSNQEHYAFIFQDPQGRFDYYDLSGKSLRKTLLKSPLNYRSVTSKFSLSRLHPILKIRRPHYGIDYAAKTGTPVVSAGDGRVIHCGWLGQYGNTVIIRHTQGYQTYYGHLSRYGKGIKKGITVNQSQVIGYVGSTGLSTGPHLDYRVKKDGKFIDPLKMELPSASPIPDEYKNDYNKVRDELLLTLQSIDVENPFKVYTSDTKQSTPTQLATKNDLLSTP